MRKMRGSRRATVVVVGNGMVGYKLCEYLSESREADGLRIVCFGEERRAAYDRVHLSDLLGSRSADDLSLAPPAWYRARGIELRLGEPIVEIDRARRRVRTRRGRWQAYDRLVLATGSAPFVPPIPGIDADGVFVYRTVDDLDAIRSRAAGARRAAVLGGGLLGLEAAKGLRDLGLETHVVEAAPHLMPRQLDADGAALLAEKIEALGVRVRVACRTERIEPRGQGLTLALFGGDELAVDLLVVSAGIRPRDEVAAAAGLELGPRGGVAVDDAMRTSDPAIYAIGECASHSGVVYGLVAPGDRMADVAASQLAGRDKRFRGGDLSTRLKLLGVDVASIGDSTASADRDCTFVTVRDELAGVYKKLVVHRRTGALRGAVLVGDVSSYPRLLQAFRAGERLPERPVSLLVEAGEVAVAGGVIASGDDALVCTCHDVSKGCLREAIAGGAATLAELKARTRAATGCGGCAPQVRQLLDAELRRRGVSVERPICEHFPMRRQELRHRIQVEGQRSFAAVLERHGRGAIGCEICKPAVASILASVTGATAAEEPAIQDTNDRFLANVQRGGTYSVVPRIPGGEIEPQKLLVLARVAEEFGLYVKVTGAQRIDLLGARIEQLPAIWERLVAAGFESGHAYAKGVRTVKSCVGSTWCRFGQLDSVAFAIRLEHRYKGLRSPHKLKAAVSGCIRECAEARSKDFGIIAAADGWKLYVCGNGGAEPRHADLLAAGLDDEECVRLIDRFLMFYIRTADPLVRTARWLEELDGGIDYLRDVVVHDRLGIAARLEAEMEELVRSYRCEWAEVVGDPVRRARFRAFVNAPGPDPSVRFAVERGQPRPASGGAAPTAPAGARDEEGVHA